MMFNDRDVIIGVMTDDITQEEESILEASGELTDVVKDYVNTGTRPKKALDNFKLILDKYEIK